MKNLVEFTKAYNFYSKSRKWMRKQRADGRDTSQFNKSFHENCIKPLKQIWASMDDLTKKETVKAIKTMRMFNGSFVHKKNYYQC